MKLDNAMEDFGFCLYIIQSQKKLSHRSNKLHNNYVSRKGSCQQFFKSTKLTCFDIPLTGRISIISVQCPDDSGRYK